MIKTHSLSKWVKKLNKDDQIVQINYFMVSTYCSRIFICDATSRFNDGTRKRNVSYLLKELNQLKHSWSWKVTTANKVIRNIRSGVKCFNHWEKRKSQRNCSYLPSAAHLSLLFNFVVVNLKLLRKSSKILLLSVTLTLHM